jgi:hypothetical protein
MLGKPCHAILPYLSWFQTKEQKAGKGVGKSVQNDNQINFFEASV